MVTAELAGLRQEDVNVTVQNGVLTISGEKRPTVTERENAGYHLQELHYGRFERSFSLPQSVAADGVRASLVNGVLTVKLPKTAAAKPAESRSTVAIRTGWKSPRTSRSRPGVGRTKEEELEARAVGPPRLPVGHGLGFGRTIGSTIRDGYAAP